MDESQVESALRVATFDPEDLCPRAVCMSVAIVQGKADQLLSIFNETKPLGSRIGELIQIVSEITPENDTLWSYVTYNPDAIWADRTSIVAKEFWQRLLEQLLRCIDDVQRAGELIDVKLTDVIVRAMEALRWCAMWAWARYEKPERRLWETGAYLYACAGQADPIHPAPYVDGAAVPLSILREYAFFLFTDWVGPSAISSEALALLYDILSEHGGEVGFSSERSSARDIVLDLRSGCIDAPGKTPSSASDDHLQYISISDVATFVRERVTEYLGSSDARIKDAAESLSCSPIGRVQRYLPRLGQRTNALQVKRLSCGWTAALEIAKMFGEDGPLQDQSQLSGRDGTTRCIVRDVSTNGCRLFITSRSLRLHVQSLVAIACPRTGAPSLGVVRWLTRCSDESWEAGIWLLSGPIAVFDATVEVGQWASGKEHEPILVIDAEVGREHNAVSVALAKGAFDLEVPLCVREANIVLRGIKLLATGSDYDLALFSVEDMH